MTRLLRAEENISNEIRARNTNIWKKLRIRRVISKRLEVVEA